MHRKGKTTEVEKAAYSTSLETVTFNIASPACREEVEADIILTEEEKRQKIEVLLDYIGPGATRYTPAKMLNWLLFFSSRTVPIVQEDDDIKERRSISEAEIARRLNKEREKWKRQKQRETQEKDASRRSRSRSRSPVGWLQRAARGGR